MQQMAERIETELHDNPALEKKMADDEMEPQWDAPTEGETPEGDDYEAQREREERVDALDAALENIGRDDEELPVYQGGRNTADEQEPMVFGEGRSFHDMLMEQVAEMELSEDDRYVVEYIIQSLDDDGLLRTPLADISEQLAIYHGIDIDTPHLEALLATLQQMDPPGIGARSLQECLLLQIERKKPSPMKPLMKTVVTDYFEDFTKKHWDHIQSAMQLS